MADEIPISGLPAASNVGLTDITPIVQSGTTKKSTFQLIQDLFSGTFVKTTGSVSVGAFPIYDPDGQNLKSSTIVTDSQLNISTPRSITLLQNADAAMKVPTLSQVQALIPTAFVAQDTVYVDPDGNNGNSGSANAPYADPFAASAAITGTTANPKLISINAGIYNTTSYSLKPNQTLWGNGFSTQLSVTNTITLDASWSSGGVGSVVYLSNLIWNNTFDLDFSAFGSGRSVYIKNCFLGTLTATGASGNVPTVRIDSCYFTNDITLESVNADLNNINITGSDGDITIQSGGSGGNTSVNIDACYFPSGTDILISGASGSTTGVRIFSSPIRGTLTLDTTFTTLTIDACSIPSGGITYTNGALSSQVTIVGSAPSRLFNNAYTGQNYVTPVAITSSSNSTAWNLNAAPSAKQTMTENTTLANPTNQIEGAFYVFVFTQGAGPYTLAFGTDYDFGGVTPTISTTNGSENIFIFRSNGSAMKCVGATLGV